MKMRKGSLIGSQTCNECKLATAVSQPDQSSGKLLGSMPVTVFFVENWGNMGKCSP